MLIDSASRFAAITKIPANNILAISHLRDINEISKRLDNVKRSHQGLVLRRLYFDSSLCNLLSNTLRRRKEDIQTDTTTNDKISSTEATNTTTITNTNTNTLNATTINNSSNTTTNYWEKVELRNVDGNIADAISVCMEYNVIVELQLVINSTDISDDGWNVLQHGIRTNSLLTSLRITTLLSSSGMRLLSNGLRHHDDENENNNDNTVCLQTLDFSWSTIEDEETVHELAAGIRDNRTIQDLHFMGCSLQDEWVEEILTALCHHPTITSLDMNGNKAGPVASRALERLIRTNQSLTRLDISFQTNDEGINIPLLSESLQVNRTLRLLDLTNCQIDDVDAERICHVLCDAPEATTTTTSSSLTDLILARNKITDGGIISISNLLSRMKTLKRLSLWGNPFNDEGARALAIGLQSNFVIEEIDLFRTFPCSDKIFYMTQLNRAGRKLMLDDVFVSSSTSTRASTSSTSTKITVPLGLWPLILDRANTKLSFPTNSPVSIHDIFFYMLRGPALLNNR